MDAHAYYELQILNHLEESPYITNRMAALKLGVSIKLTHSILKGLVKRGLVHARKRDGRSLYHFLTPQGVAEKVKLTYEFMNFTTQFYREARKRSSEVCRRLVSRGKRKVAFLGCGELAEITYLGVKEHGLQLTGVYDTQKSGDTFLGLVVKSAECLDGEKPRKEKFDSLLVTTYNPAEPAKEHYLPEGVTADDRFVWIFDREEMIEEVAEKIPAFEKDPDENEK